MKPFSQDSQLKSSYEDIAVHMAMTEQRITEQSKSSCQNEAAPGSLPKAPPFSDFWLASSLKADSLAELHPPELKPFLPPRLISMWMGEGGKINSGQTKKSFRLLCPPNKFHLEYFPFITAQPIRTQKLNHKRFLQSMNYSVLNNHL